MSVVLGARDAASGRRMVQYLNRASANGGTVGVVPNSPLPVPQTAPSSEEGYTGGFRLVDMSETVKEKDEDGNEYDTVTRRVGIIGVDPTEENPHGTLYFSMGATIYTMPGFVVDVSDVLPTLESFVYAYWIGDKGNVLVTKNGESAESVAGIGAGLYIPIGSYTVNQDDSVTVKQLFHGTMVNFVYRQPFLALIKEGQEIDPVSGFVASLYSYPTPDDLRGKEPVQGKVFLSDCCLGDSNTFMRDCYMTVHPVATQILEVTLP